MKLFYREFGDKNNPVLIVLHGLFGMSDNWVSIAKILSQNRFVIVPDLRNHGNSPHSDDFDYSLMTQDILELLELKQLKDVEIIGHSMGGKLAMNIALNYPEKVNKLIVADMSMKEGELRDIHATILNTIARTDLAIFRTYAEIEAWFDTFIDKKKVVLFALKNIKKDENDHFSWKLNYYSLFQNTHKIMEQVVGFEPFTKPTLFIRGGDSDYITDEDIPEIMEWFPYAEIKTIEGASHWVHADNPKVFMEMVIKFLSK